MSTHSMKFHIVPGQFRLAGSKHSVSGAQLGHFLHHKLGMNVILGSTKSGLILVPNRKTKVPADCKSLTLDQFICIQTLRVAQTIAKFMGGGALRTGFCLAGNVNYHGVYLNHEKLRNNFTKAQYSVQEDCSVKKSLVVVTDSHHNKKFDGKTITIRDLVACQPRGFLPHLHKLLLVMAQHSVLTGQSKIGNEKKIKRVRFQGKGVTQSDNDSESDISDDGDDYSATWQNAPTSLLD